MLIKKVKSDSFAAQSMVEDQRGESGYMPLEDQLLKPPIPFDSQRRPRPSTHTTKGS